MGLSKALITAARKSCKKHGLKPMHHNLARLMQALKTDGHEGHARRIMQEVSQRDNVTLSCFIEPGLRILQ
jgi:hypothetical protein